MVEGGNAEMIPDDQCPSQKAITMRDCQILKRCPVWSVGQWSKVQTTVCGIILTVVGKDQGNKVMDPIVREQSAVRNK